MYLLHVGIKLVLRVYGVNKKKVQRSLSYGVELAGLGRRIVGRRGGDDYGDGAGTGIGVN